MKLMIASDIHGSAYYCKKMVAAYQREHADRLLLLGDILPWPPAMISPKDYDPKPSSLLNPLEAGKFAYAEISDTEVDQMVLDFPIMAEYCLLELNGQTIFATHGHHFNPQNPPMLKDGDILLTGILYIRQTRIWVLILI